MRQCQTAGMQSVALSKLGKILPVILALVLALVGQFHVQATILTFEDFPSSNIHLNTVANPFGSGQYGSRATSAINAGFQQGEGWTTNVVVTWGTGWQTYTGWPFGNDAQTGAGRVAQADFQVSAGAPITITFTPDAGFG